MILNVAQLSHMGSLGGRHLTSVLTVCTLIDTQFLCVLYNWKDAQEEYTGSEEWCVRTGLLM